MEWNFISNIWPCFFFCQYIPFQMKIIASVTKSLHDPCYLYLPIFFLYKNSPLKLENERVIVITIFPQQIRPQTTVQWYILQDYSSVRISFNMNNKCHTLPIAYTQGLTITIKSPYAISYLSQNFSTHDVRRQISKSIYQVPYFLPSDFSNNLS